MYDIHRTDPVCGLEMETVIWEHLNPFGHTIKTADLFIGQTDQTAQILSPRWLCRAKSLLVNSNVRVKTNQQKQSYRRLPPDMTCLTYILLAMLASHFIVHKLQARL